MDVKAQVAETYCKLKEMACASVAERRTLGNSRAPPD